MSGDDSDVVRSSLSQPQSFGAIFEGHHHDIWRYLARAGGRDAADDLAGEVFVIAFAQRGRYDASKGSVRGWLYGIARNLLRTYCRSKVRRTRALGRAAAQRSNAVPSTEAVEDALAGTQEVLRIRRAVMCLSEAHGEVLMLFVWEGLSYEEIAVVLSVEVGTVRSRLARARTALRCLTVEPEEPTDRAVRK